MTCSCPSVKGHLTNKSTAFSPSGAKYGTQSLIHNHMMAHYQKIDRAKSVIDNKPPKSMKNFIKAHTKTVQFQKNKSMSRASSPTPQLLTAMNLHVDQSSFDVDRPHTAPPGNRMQSSEIETSLKPSKKLNSSLETLSFQDHLRNESSQLHSFKNSDFSQSFSTKRSTSYRTPLKIELYKSATPRYKIEMYSPDSGPPHINGSVFNMTRPNWKSTSLSHERTLSHNKHDLSYPETHLKSNFGASFDKLLLKKDAGAQRAQYAVLRTQEEMIAEEQAYLKFVEEVTNDVIARGIFSDRVLNQVFESHIERKKDSLDEERMRYLIAELKEDLNIQDDEINLNETI